jgi:COMPASS component SWD3
VHEDNPPVTNVCFSPNGRFILAFNLDNSIRLWDYVGGTVKKTYQGHSNKGYSIGGSFSLLAEEDQEAIDGNGADREPQIQPFVASASEEGEIVLWDVKTKSVVQRICGAHKGVCFWVDVNGGIMVSAGQDRVINVFRQASILPNGRATLQPHELESETPNLAAAADDELQRQIQEEAGSPLRHVKEELV